MPSISTHQAKPIPTGISQGSRAATYSMFVKGQKQGHIKGDAPKTWKKAEEHIQLVHWEHSIISPRDTQSGLPTGQRMHGAVEVLGKNNKACPLLWTALCTNENLNEVRIDCWSQDAAGAGKTAVIYYTLKLTNANIAHMEHVTSEVDGTLFFRCSFTYQTVEWTWVNGGITSQDDWVGKLG